MSSPRPDPAFTYENPFSNTIFANQTSANMGSQASDDPVYQRFTATGRPLTQTARNSQGALSGGMAGMDSLGQSAPNHLPVRFTDDSIISVPVLPNAEPSQLKSDTYDVEEDSLKDSTKPKSRFSISSFRRKSSSGNARNSKQDFIIKKMKRSEYLEHYAKDDNGKYIGSEDPALDCILNNEEDRIKWGRS